MSIRCVDTDPGFYLKALLVQFVRRAETRQFDLEQVKPVDPVAVAKAKRVEKHKDSMVIDMTTLKSEVETLAKVKPDTEPGMLVHLEKVQETRDRVKTVLEAAVELCDDATEAALGDEAEVLYDAIHALRKQDPPPTHTTHLPLFMLAPPRELL